MSFGLKGLLKKEMGCPCCERRTPMPTLDASVSTVNGSLKSGKVKTDTVDKACFSVSKAT